MTIHILAADGSQGRTIYNVERLEERNGMLVCRMEFSDIPQVLPKGAFVNVECDDSDDETEE